MRNFIVRCLVLAIVFYAGVYIGVNKTSEETVNKRESSAQSFLTPISKQEIELAQVRTIEYKQNHQIQLGNTDEQADAANKNILSEVGKGLAGIVTAFAQKTISLFTYFI